MNPFNPSTFCLEWFTAPFSQSLSTYAVNLYEKRKDLLCNLTKPVSVKRKYSNVFHPAEMLKAQRHANSASIRGDISSTCEFMSNHPQHNYHIFLIAYSAFRNSTFSHSRCVSPVKGTSAGFEPFQSTFLLLWILGRAVRLSILCRFCLCSCKLTLARTEERWVTTSATMHCPASLA